MIELPLFTRPENLKLNFFAEGVPAPGGSKTVIHFWRRDGTLVTKWVNGRQMPIFNVTDDAGHRNKTWKTAVAWQAKSFMRGAKPFDGALKVEFVFFLRRPQSHYRTGKFSHLLRDDAPEHHIQAPDALKYARSTEDACTGIVWHDDSRNVDITSRKRWMRHGDREGCAITILVLPCRNQG